MVPPSRPADAEPLPADLGHATPEQQLTHALACFQAEVSPITAADLAAVAHSARPAFRRGISWSAQLREKQGRSRLQVTVMHVAGADLCSEAWGRFQGHMEAHGIDLASTRATLGRTLRLDPATEEYLGDAEANAMRRGTYAEGFVVPEEV